MDIVSKLGAYILLGARTVRATFQGKFPWKNFMLNMYNIGNRSLTLVTFVTAFLGMIGIYETCMQMLKLLPQLSVVGMAAIPVVIRELAPLLVALMLATRVGAGIAAEIGSMKVTDQLDAMILSGTDPIHYLLVPKLAASFVMTIALVVWGTAITILAGMLIADMRFGVNPRTFFDLRMTRMSDVVIALIKAAAFGLTIPIVSAESGFSAKGGSEGVGWATTSAVVNASFLCIILDFVISAIGYLITG